MRAISRNPVVQAADPGSLIVRLGFHYGWIIVAVSASLSVAAGFSIQGLGLAYTYLHDHAGWDPGQIALAGSLFFLTASLAAPVTGIVTDRYGAAKAAATGVGLTLLGALVTGAATEVWHFWIGYGLFLGPAFTVIRIATTVAVSDWFRHRLGLAIGILQASFAAGPAVLIMVVSVSLETMGWRGTVWIFGFIGCASLGALMLLFRGRPVDLGLRPYGAGNVDTQSQPYPAPIRDLRSRTYWNSLKGSGTFRRLITLHTLGSVGHVVVVVYIVPVAVHSGIGPVAAGGILSVLTGISMVSRFCAPIVADRFVNKQVIVSVLLLQSLPILVLFHADALWQFYLVGLVFGLGFGGVTPITMVFTRKYFGPGPMGRPMGCYEIFQGLAVSAGLWLSGMSFSVLGTYDYALVLAVGCGVLAVALAVSLKPVDAAKYFQWERHLPLEARSKDFYDSFAGKPGLAQAAGA